MSSTSEKANVYGTLLAHGKLPKGAAAGTQAQTVRGCQAFRIGNAGWVILLNNPCAIEKRRTMANVVFEYPDAATDPFFLQIQERSDQQINLDISDLGAEPVNLDEQITFEVYTIPDVT